MRHLLPAADYGKGKEGLTALCNSVRNDYSIYRQTKSMSRLFRRFGWKISLGLSLDKAGGYAIIKTKGRCYSSQTRSNQSF